MNVIKLYDSRNSHMEDNLWDAYSRTRIHKGGFRSFVQDHEGIVSMNQDGDVTFESEVAMMMFILRWS
jgi:hypothetical protein